MSSKMQILIQYDYVTGELGFNGPEDPVIFMGILEMVKGALLAANTQDMRKREAPPKEPKKDSDIILLHRKIPDDIT